MLFPSAKLQDLVFTRLVAEYVIHNVGMKHFSFPNGGTNTGNREVVYSTAANLSLTHFYQRLCTNAKLLNSTMLKRCVNKHNSVDAKRFMHTSKITHEGQLF